MIVKICDICGNVINDTQNEGRQDTEFEIHLIGVLHEGGPEERKHFDMCGDCMKKMTNFFKWPTDMIRRRLYG